MNYYYYKDNRGNVGDDLNAILLPYFFNDLLNTEKDGLLVGIGTLINDKLPDSSHYHLFTSGYGYQNPPKFEGKRLTAIGLRGPMTLSKLAPYLDVDVKKIPLIDGAYLTPLVIKKKILSNKKIGLIPHVDSVCIGMWQKVADVAGYELIDPRLEPKDFIEKLTSCDRVITEAMHGAILADAYRVSWVPYYAYGHINLAKWSDWGDSLNLSTNMHKVTPTFKGDLGLPFSHKIKNTIKRAAKVIRVYSDDWTTPPETRSSQSVVEIVASELNKIDRANAYQLSSEGLINSKLEHLQENIHSVLKG